MSVIALFSKAYCSSDEIASQVAERLGYTVASHKVLEIAAEESGIPAKKIARTMIGSKGFLDSLTRDWEKSLVHIKAALAQTLRTDEQIIHGPAIHLIPPTIGHVLRVEVVASQDYRVQRAMEQEGVDAKEAAQLVEKNNEDVAQWLQHIVAHTGGAISPYDIKIPLPATSLEEAVDTICQNAEKDAVKPTDRSIQAVLDFQLAARINLALVERKYYSSNVTVDNGKVTVVLNQGSTPQGKLARTMQALRFENAEEDVREICISFEGVKEVHVRPGSGYRRGSKTLLVDDEKEYVMTLSERLEMRDIDSDVVYNGEEALTFMETGTPDVMVLDLRMPGMHGFEVLERIKRDHPQVQVIIVTGHGGEKARQRAFELGAFDYMDKPVDINELAEKIQKASLKAEKEREELSTNTSTAEKDD